MNLDIFNQSASKPTSNTLWECFNNLFDLLPLFFCPNSDVLCVHGGIAVNPPIFTPAIEIYDLSVKYQHEIGAGEEIDPDIIPDMMNLDIMMGWDGIRTDFNEQCGTVSSLTKYGGFDINGKYLELVINENGNSKKLIPVSITKHI